MSADPGVTGHRLPPAPLLVRLCLVAVSAPLLARAGLPRLQRWLEPARPPVRPSSERVDAIGRQSAAWVDGIIARGAPIVRPGCLTRGITLYYALRRDGVDVALAFGVGTDQGAPAGHCWLDLEGRPFLERVDPLDKFTEVVRVTSAGVRQHGA